MVWKMRRRLRNMRKQKHQRQGRPRKLRGIPTYVLLQRVDSLGIKAASYVLGVHADTLRSELKRRKKEAKR